MILGLTFSFSTYLIHYYILVYTTPILVSFSRCYNSKNLISYWHSSNDYKKLKSPYGQYVIDLYVTSSFLKEEYTN